VLTIGIAARPGTDNAQVVYKPSPAVLATTDAHESVR
jgi:hypothetical protein